MASLFALGAPLLGELAPIDTVLEQTDHAAPRLVAQVTLRVAHRSHLCTLVCHLVGIHGQVRVLGQVSDQVVVQSAGGHVLALGGFLDELDAVLLHELLQGSS